MVIATIHRLPIRTKFRGVTDVAENFDPTIRKRNRDHEDTLLLSRFRGRRLVGGRLQLTSSGTPVESDAPSQVAASTLPAAYTGAILMIAAKPLEPESGSAMSSEGAPGVLSSSESAASDLCRRVTVWDTFTSIVLWEHDREPPALELRSMGSWLNVATAIHNPTSEASSSL